MSKTFNKFSTSKRIVARGLVIMTIFATIASAVSGPAIMAGVPVAHADTATSTSTSIASSSSDSSSSTSCSVATAMSVSILTNPTPQVGQDVTYEISGSPAFTASTTVSVDVVIPAGLTYVSSDPSVGSYSHSTGTWNAGTLNGASNITLDIAAKVNAGTEGQTITIAPHVHYVESDCSQSSAVSTASITVQNAPAAPVADISISKTADVTSTSEGATVNYTVTAKDLGPATSTDVVATDKLPAGLTFVSATASEGSYASSTGIWTVGDVSASSTATLTIAASVNWGTTGTTIKNAATVKESSSETDPNTANNSASVSIPVIAGAPCTLTAAQFVAAKRSGVITVTPVTLGTGTASYTVKNGTSCSIPTLSFASYEAFQPKTSPHWLSSQVLFDSTSTSSVAPGATQTFTVNVPTCLAQVDAWFGNTPVTLLDSNPYAYPNVPFALVYTVTTSPVCVATTTPPSADISIVKTANVTSTEVGTTVDYTVKVTDNGPATSTGVVATDVLPAGLTFVSATASEGSYASSTGIWTVGDVSASSTATLTIAASVNAGTENTDITNTATVTESSAETDSNLSNNSSSVTICICPSVTTPTSTPTSTVPSADISIVKTVDNANPAEGTDVNYTLTVAALGPATSTGVVASDTLPSGVTFVSATSSEGSYASSTGTWTIGDMSASSTATLTIEALVNNGTAGDTITNTATVCESASSTDNNLANNSSSVSIVVQSNGGGGGVTTPSADVSIVKTANATSTTVGGTVDYTLTVADNGPATSTGVVATDVLPSGLTFENATASVGTYASSTGVWTIGDLSASSTATLVIDTLVNAGTAGSTITNTATVTESSAEIDSNPGNNSSTVSIPVASNGGGGGGNDADIAIAKTVDNANPAGGATVNYTVTVTDNGPATSTFVVAQDQLPIGLAMIVATTSQGSYNIGTGVWTIGTVGPTATATLNYSAAVSSAYDGQTITNTATVSQLSSIVDPNLANNSSTVSINVQPAPCTSNCGGGGGGGNSPSAQLGIVKTVDNADPVTGATIHYTLTVSATGPSASLGVVANDVLPAGVAFVSASSSEGSYASSTGVWTIGEMPDGTQATLVITATVTAADGSTVTNTGTVSESPAVVNPLTGNTSSSVTINVGGNGGGGGGNGGGNGGGGGGGSVLGASTSTQPGQVLGASCGLYLTEYIHPIRQYLNDPVEVKKLQVFLNMNLGLNLAVNGVYNTATIAAVNQFQVKYHIEVLKPWLPLGLPTQFTPTSYVYQTTQRWINLIMCPPLNIPMPTLHVDNGV